MLLYMAAQRNIRTELQTDATEISTLCENIFRGEENGHP